MKLKAVRKYPLPDNLTLEQVYNFSVVNDVDIEIHKGKAYYKLYEIEYDLETYQEEKDGTKSKSGHKKIR